MLKFGKAWPLACIGATAWWPVPRSTLNQVVKHIIKIASKSKQVEASLNLPLSELISMVKSILFWVGEKAVFLKKYACIFYQKNMNHVYKKYKKRKPSSEKKKILKGVFYFKNW